jgi:hypothetical protein
VLARETDGDAEVVGEGGKVEVVGESIEVLATTSEEQASLGVMRSKHARRPRSKQGLA